jgi:hypothetical protein
VSKGLILGDSRGETMMKNPIKSRLITFVVSATLMANVAMAHGDKKHIVGRLEKVNADSVVVKTTAGESVEVKLVASTTYVSRVGNEDRSAKVSDLAVGDRVVIHATPRGETLEANEVKFSAPASSAASSETKGKPKT